ncbi:MAG: hypothetical protein AB1941_29135 [Gemmatimonadota bacterium]
MDQATGRVWQVGVFAALILSVPATPLYYVSEGSVRFTYVQWLGFGSLALGAGFAGVYLVEWASRRKPGMLSIIDLSIALGAVAVGYLLLTAADLPNEASIRSWVVALMLVLTVVRRRVESRPARADGSTGG